MNEPEENDSLTSDTADPGLERLLAEVYAAPAVPKSLLKRIDRGVQDEWGESPKLVSQPTVALSRSLAMTRRWFGAVPIAACMVVAVAWFALFGTNAGACAWSAIVDAIAKQGVVEIAEVEGVRWLSLSDGVSGRQSASHSSLLDTRRRVTLTRLSGENTINRYRQASSPQRVNNDQLLVSFLAGSLAGEDSQRWAGLRVISEKAELVTKGDVEQYQLQVKFQTNAEALDMRLTVDPATLLPLACEVVAGSGEVASSSLQFTGVTLAELRKQNFPSDIKVVDVDRAGADMIAASLSGSNAAGSESDRSNREGIAETAPIKADISSVGLLKAATTWKAVNVVRRTPNEVLERVDSVLEELWATKDVQPTQFAGTDELMRRVYLDLAGRTPSVSEIRAYMKEPVESRYENLVDRLLQSPDHASHLATVFRSFLIPEGVDLDAFGGVEEFDRWLAKRFEKNEPYDDIVRALLLSEGRLSRSGPLLFYSATKLDPDQLASRTSRVFLGMRLECAQCHDHPFEPWTQEDFWSYAAFFAQISRPKGELETVSTVMRVHDVDRGEVMLPETETVVPPRFLDGTPFNEGEKAAARRAQLAKWLTGADNPYFARAAANRVWGQMFGAGIVNPIDDFGELNPPVSPALLDTLAGHFIDTGFDLRKLFRLVALSSAYRRSSGDATVDETRLQTFAQMNVKTLTAEQIYDCITVASMLQSSGANRTDFNVDRFGNSSREQFLQQFRTPSQDRTSFDAGIPQALTLMNGSLIEGATGLSSGGRLKSLEAPFFTNQQRIEVLYLATLSRKPVESEWKVLRSYLPENVSGDERQQVLADVLWALLNSAEFTMNH